jgi:protein-L-isoaspartate(D-aspartate) O-methyltransferase
MSDLAAQRRFFAEEIETVANIQSPVLVEALATVPRERFLPPGPWTIRSEADLQSPPRQTPDAEPRRVYHNVAIAIDPARTLFNGAPGLLAMSIESLSLKPGDRVLHLGTGPGYYTALMAACVGPTGRVLGLEVDPALASAARENLTATPWVEVRESSGAGQLDEAFDAILINAGVTHALERWLDAVAPGGRMLLPLTATMPAMGPIGKGFLVRVDRPSVHALTSSPAQALPWTAKLLTVVAIYSAIGVRDDSLNMALGQAMRQHPFPQLKTFRRDPHEASASCWFHTPSGCFSI